MESGYYPPGAEFDPNAPYNQSTPTPITIEVEAYVTYKKVLKVELDDYVVEEGGVDEDGYTIPDTYVFDSSILPELVEEQYDLSKEGWEIEDVEAYEFD